MCEYVLIFCTCTNASPAATKTGILKGLIKMKNVIKAVIVVSAFIGMTNVALAQSAASIRVMCLNTVDAAQSLRVQGKTKNEAHVKMTAVVQEVKFAPKMSEAVQGLVTMVVNKTYEGVPASALKQVCLK